MLFGSSSYRRFLLGMCLGILGIFSLLLLAISLIMPVIKSHPQWVAHWLSDRVGMSVQFDQLTTLWTRRGPLLRLSKLRIAQQQAPVVKEAEIILVLYSGFLPGHALTELRLRGLEMTLRQDGRGHWSVVGLPPQRDNDDSDPYKTVSRLGEVQISGGRLHIEGIKAFKNGAFFSKVDLRMRAYDHRLRLGVHAWLDSHQPPLKAALALDAQHGSGQLYIAAMPCNLAAWSPLLVDVPVNIIQGMGALRLWAQFDHRQLTQTQVDIHLHDVSLQARSALSAHHDRSLPVVHWSSVQLKGLWQRQRQGWSLFFPRLRLAEGGHQDWLDGVAIAQAQRIAIVAQQPMRLDLVVKAVASSGLLSQKWQSWLINAAPTVRLSRLIASAQSAQDYKVRAMVDEVKIAPVGQIPGVDGFRAELVGDHQGIMLTPLPSATVQFLWPSGFGAPVAFHLTGSIVAWPGLDQWQAQTSQLQVSGTDFSVTARGGFAYELATAQTRLFLVAVVDRAQLPVAKQFWIHSHMAKSAVDWLNMALIGGQVSQAVGLAEGYIQHWPFENAQGHFEVSAQVDDGKIRFSPDWPVAQNLHANIHFLGNGLIVSGRGTLGKIMVDRLDASIANFSQSQLRVDASGHGESHEALALLDHSPLRSSYGEVFHSLILSGPVQARFGLTLPLANASSEPRQLQGNVAFDGVDAFDKSLNLAFKHIQGQLEYSDNGFRALGLNVQFDNQSGQLDLRCGEFVNQADHRFEAQLHAPIHPDALFARVPQIGWLRPYVQGQSIWQIGVNAIRQNQSQLVFESDLVGTALTLPEPMQKSTTEALPIRVATAYPFDQAEIQVSLGDRLGMRIQSRNNQLGIGAVLGSNHLDTPLPVNGLRVTGATPVLDAFDWISVVHQIMQPPISTVSTQSSQSTTQSNLTLPLQNLDVVTDRLLLLGGQFPNTHLTLTSIPNGLAVHLQGPALAGTLQVPSDAVRQITGQLERFYWQSIPAKTPRSQPVEASLSQADESLDPAQIPGVLLTVNDVGIDNVHLGPLRVDVRQQGGGLDVEQLQLFGPVQTMTLTGRWQGKDAPSYTRLNTHISSQNLGELAKVFGFGSQLQGGQGRVDIQAGWQGSPLHLGFDSLQGHVAVDARNGQLSEIHPGAGRVLSFLSVTQLPRRLMFDFRDLFDKGLAFNTLNGQIDFADGFARTQTLKMNGPAADIAIRGVADLVHGTFDQTVDVNPRSGNLLTVVGAVAGGPVGAAVGAAATAVLGKPLSAIGARRYHLTGPWNDPKVDVVPFTPATNPNPPHNVTPMRDAASPPP